MTDRERRGTRLIRIAQLLLVLAAGGLWAAGRLTWVTLETADGLGQPRTVELSGSTWSTALLPVALLLLAAAVAALAVRGLLLRMLALLLAAVSAAIGYLGVSQWVVADVSVRAAELTEVPFFTVVDSQRHYGGAALTVVVALVTLAAAVLLIRAAAVGPTGARRYERPAARRGQRAEPGTRSGSVGAESEASVSERGMWDALDEGQDPTVDPSGPAAAGGAPAESEDPAEGR